MTFLIISIVLGAYLLGSINIGILLCKLLHLPDPRTQGSKNPGATNVLRVAGKGVAIITLIFDMAKGMIPVLAAKHVGLAAEWQAVVALSATLGHMYPIFFHFRGGKGVATGAGAIVALAWPLGLTVFALWLLVMFATRYVSLSSMVVSFALPFIVYAEGYEAMIWPLSVMGILSVAKHHANIRRLLQGKEDKFKMR